MVLRPPGQPQADVQETPVPGVLLVGAEPYLLEPVSHLVLHFVNRSTAPNAAALDERAPPV